MTPFAYNLEKSMFVLTRDWINQFQGKMHDYTTLGSKCAHKHKGLEKVIMR